jgi:hypothetical protein
VIEVKNKYATERKEQHDRISQIDKVKIYMIKKRVLIIPENYSEEPLYERKRLITLQDRPPTPYIPAGSSARLQRDSRIIYGYIVSLTEG